MTYTLEQIEYRRTDGTMLWLDGTAELSVYIEKGEPQTWTDPGVPASVELESIDSVNIETVALMVNDNTDCFGLLNVGQIESDFLKELESYIEGAFVDMEATNSPIEADIQNWLA